MSDKVQGWVWDLPDLLPQRRLGLLWLASYCDDGLMLGDVLDREPTLAGDRDSSQPPGSRLAGSVIGSLLKDPAWWAAWWCSWARRTSSARTTR
jgi:hypothetical protein